MNKKNKILKVFSFVVISFVLLLSAFTFISNGDNKLDFASADGVDISYNFTGSNLFMFDAFMSNGNANGWYVCSTRNSFYKNYNDDNIYAKSDFYWQQNASTFNTTYKMYYYDGTSYVLGDAPLLPNSHRFVYFSNDSVSANTGGGFPCDIIASGNFNGNVFSIELGTKSDLTNMSVNFTGYKCFYMKYFDSDNNYISYEFIMPSSVVFDTRSYYLTRDFSDNQIYNEGYNAGLSANQDNIYNNGYRAGDIDGYNRGFQAGIVDANDYSFTGLFGAVIDAPIRVFSDLINFNLLGVNLLSFITGLISLVVIIYIVKVCVGGK